MKVAQIMAGAAEGGAELFFERLSGGMEASGLDILPIIRRNQQRAERLRHAGMTPAELAFGPPIDLLTRPRMRRILRAFAPDAAVYWMNRANQHRVHGDWCSIARLGGYYDLRHYRGCDHLVGNTRGIVAWLRERGWSAERTHYLPNFVEDFGATAPADLAPMGLPPGDRLVLALGRLHTDKGFDLLIQAMTRVPRATLAIAGSGPERARLERLAARAGVGDRTRFLGWRDDAGALLRAADVFACSSRIEPLGNMVIEAWSANCPLVAAASAGPRELIRDGEDGTLAPLEDPRALGDAIATALADPARAAAMARAGRRRFEDEYSAASVIGLWRAFLDRVVAERRAGMSL